MHNAFLLEVQAGLVGLGHACVRFNFPYKESGRRAPDTKPVLERCYRSVVEQLREEMAPSRLVIGGKSMGGRIASLIAAAGVATDGLLFLGYPLHPAGKPDQLRTEHLVRIRAPMLFLAGTRDPLCRLDLLRESVRHLEAPVQVHVVDGGDHSFRVPKKSGRAESDVREEILSTCGAWLRAIHS